MSSKTKRLSTVLFALAAAVCLALALFFGSTPRTASAFSGPDANGVLTLDDSDLVVSDGVITGLSENAKTEIAKNTTKSYTLTISGTATGIAGEAFKGQQKLTSLTISSASLTEIGKEAFYGTTGLTSLTLNDALVTIGESAFAVSANSTAKLDTLTVPANVKNIGNLAFANRAYLTTINFYATACDDFAEITGANSSALSAAISAAASNNPFYRAGAVNSGNKVTVNIGRMGGTPVTKIPAGMFIASNRANNGIAAVHFNNVNLADGAFGDYSFYYCNNLTEVAFLNSSSVVSIGACAFYNCSSLTNIILPTSLTKIENGAFYNCSSLAGISIPDGVSTIEDSVFRGCSSLASVNLNKVTTISSNAFYQCSDLAAVNIPASVTTIGASAFHGCTNLKSVDFTGNSNLTTISQRAFYDCVSLTRIIIPGKVTSVGDSAYTGCTSVTSIDYYAEQANDFAAASQSHPFGSVGSAGTGVTVCIGSDSSNIKKIPENLFYYSGSSLNITNVNFTNIGSSTGKVAIGANAFRNCQNLSSVAFLNNNCNISEIGSYAFYNCQALTSFELVNGIEKIGDNAFQSCNSILTITLPSSLTSIGTQAFNGCVRLFEVVNLSNSFSLEAGSDSDGEVAKYALSVVTSAGASAIITSSNGLHFIEKEENNRTKYYLVGAISTLNGRVVLPDSVPNHTNTGYDIYQYAFQNLNKINEVVIPSTVSVIGDYAFYQCKALKTVTINEDGNNGVREIGQNAFAGCSALTTINLPAKLVEIKSDLFQNCVSLKQIEIPANVTEIGSMAFQNTGLTSIVIPANVETVNTSAFEGCKDLASVTFLKEQNTDYKLKNIGFGAFKDCTSLGVIVIPNTVTRIDGEAFSGATSLVTVYLPDSATYGTNIFNGCNTNIVIISSSKDAFANDSAALNSQRQTYIVDVDLIYNHNDSHIVKKLYNFDYSYELQSDNITWKNTGKKLPVQEGYSQSIWYSDDSWEEGKKLTEEQITEMLRGDAAIRLYARYVAKPDHTVNGLNYADFADELIIDKGNLDKINDKLFGAEILTEEHEFSLTAYNPFIGSVSLPGYIKDAGVYTIEVTLNPEYGVWDAPYKLTFTVEKQVVNISDTSVLNWVVKNENSTSLLNSERLWLPVSGSGDPYVAAEEGMPDGYEEKYIAQSVTRYSGRDWELIIADPSGKFTISNYSHTKERNIGIYKAEAVITPTNNYSLSTGSGVTDYGITCIPNNSTDGSYTVYKDWYIVAIANTLWIPGTSEKYDIKGWTYNQEGIEKEIPAAPVLTHGDSSESELVTFTLSLEIDGVMTELFTKDNPAKYSEYSRWINKSMPAGNYTLTIDVKGTQVGGDAVADMHEVYKFTVAKATLDSGIAAELVSSVNEELNDKKFTYAYDGQFKVAYEKVQELIDSVKETTLNPNRNMGASNGWAGAGYDNYFGPFSIGYNLSEMRHNRYLTVNELYSSEYAPTAAGEYVVYYQLSAPNYESLVASADNKTDYAFDVVIYEEIITNLLNTGNYTYTGSVIVPFTSNERYQVISLEASETIIDPEIIKQNLTVTDRNYTDVGTPKIVLKISNPAIYKWQKSAGETGVTLFGDNDEYLLISFEIVRCENSTTRSLDIIRWSWGSYQASVNRPIWTTRFGTEYTFTLTSVANSRTYSQERFGEAPAGEYTLKASAAGGEGYNWEPFEATATINILKADNYWDVVPTVYDWLYGEYETRVAGPAAKPHFGEASAVTTSYYKLNADGVIEGQKYESIDKLLVDGEVPVGQYLMRVEVAGNNNYNAMPVTDIRFRVSQAYNSWLEVPFVIGWSEGHYDRTENRLNRGGAKFGEVIIKVTDSEGNEIDVENFDKLSVGNYTVTAYVEGTANYYEMQPITTTFAVVEDSVSMTGLIAATMVFAVLAVGLAVAAVLLLVKRSREIEAEFRKMIKKELGRK